MIRPKLVVVRSDREEQPRSFQDSVSYRFDVSRNKLVFCLMGFVVALCFMFTLGVFVGRGVSMVKPDDFSMKGRFLRFLGLETPSGRLDPAAAESWEDPEKMVESLEYYEDLTHKGGTNMATAPKAAETNSAPLHVGEPAKEPSKRPSAVSRPSLEKQPSVDPEKKQTAGAASQRYTLLVASLKEPEAQVLIAKLKAAGYSPIVESLDLGAVKWNRIFLGSFPTREAAIAFAGEFNRKEKLEALVTRNPD